MTYLDIVNTVPETTTREHQRGMEIYRNSDLFRRLKGAPGNEWETLKDWEVSQEWWPIFPGLAGLDRITVSEDQVTFHDRGINGRDNTFCVRPK